MSDTPFVWPAFSVMLLNVRQGQGKQQAGQNLMMHSLLELLQRMQENMH